VSDHSFEAADVWRTTFPGAFVAALTMHNVINPPTNEALDAAKRALEAELATRWSGKSRADIRADPILAIYDAYYKRFGQNYHVQMQIESVALKGKPIPSRAALVEAMFMAELATGLLTAVHDLDELDGSVVVDVATGVETYTRYDGAEERCKPGDMFINDGVGVLTSIIQGPTTHARATPETTNALFYTYALPGIPESLVNTHLDLIERHVRLIAPNATVVDRTVIGA
jgi:DNA/RNA-binding domain of Phe-tRNA-synthetase-like protein